MELEKNVTLVDLPAVDTTQDIYIKGFIFPTFSEKYLKPMLEHVGLNVKYYNLNKGNLKRKLEEIKKSENIYTHLTANKYYSFKLFKKVVKKPLIVGGPLPKFRPDLFTEDIVIDNELEEGGLFKLFNLKAPSPWYDKDFRPSNPKKLFKNKSVCKDFSSIILTSRGCPFNCTFCLLGAYHKRVHNRHLFSIKKELELLKKSNSVFIADPSVTLNKFYLQLFDMLKEFKNLKYSLNVRADQLTDKMINKLKRMNIRKLYIGVEYPKNNILCKINKGETVEIIEERLDKLDEEGINYHLSFILGLERDQKEWEDIRKFVRKTSPETVSIHFLIPHPGTKYESLSRDWFKSKSWPFDIQNLVLGKEKAKKLKRQFEGLLGYPQNRYHTITPHNHSKTFKIINKQLSLLERIVTQL